MSDGVKYSIVMAYRNRRQLLINTLNTIKHSAMIDEIEVIVVDDGSSQHERIDDLPDKFPFEITVGRIEPKDRWYSNPCIPFNTAMRAARGEVVIIQNPETLHTADIIFDISQRDLTNIYLTYGVYSLNRDVTNGLSSLDYSTPEVFARILQTVQPFQDRGNTRVDGWFNHSVFRPMGFHFLSVITRQNLERIGYFDERFAEGVDYEDLEFITRIRRTLELVIVDNVIALHQYHDLIAYDHPNIDQLRKRNLDLFNSIK